MSNVVRLRPHGPLTPERIIADVNEALQNGGIQAMTVTFWSTDGHPYTATSDTLTLEQLAYAAALLNRTLNKYLDVLDEEEVRD